MRSEDRTKTDAVRKVERPWGSYKVLHTGEGYQVKLIEVRPGEALSLQYHRKRSEYWVVVRGNARVTIDDSVRDCQAGETVFVPMGAKHRIENLSASLFAIIEVQLGSYLGEDDIVRLEDRYGRM